MITWRLEDNTFYLHFYDRIFGDMEESELEVNELEGVVSVNKVPAGGSLEEHGPRIGGIGDEWARGSGIGAARVGLSDIGRRHTRARGGSVIRGRTRGQHNNTERGGNRAAGPRGAVWHHAGGIGCLAKTV